jgi:hypothetical protein
MSTGLPFALALQLGKPTISNARKWAPEFSPAASSKLRSELQLAVVSVTLEAEPEA